MESIAGTKGRRPFTRSKSLSCGRSPAILPTVQGAGSKLGDIGHPTPRGDAQPTRRAQSRAIEPGLPASGPALPPRAGRFPRFQARFQTPHEPGLGALAPLRRPSRDQALEPSSHADPHPQLRLHHQKVRSYPRLRPRWPVRLRGPKTARIREKASQGHGPALQLCPLAPDPTNPSQASRQRNTSNSVTGWGAMPGKCLRTRSLRTHKE